VFGGTLSLTQSINQPTVLYVVTFLEMPNVTKREPTCLLFICVTQVDTVSDTLFEDENMVKY